MPRTNRSLAGIRSERKMKNGENVQMRAQLDIVLSEPSFLENAWIGPGLVMASSTGAGTGAENVPK